MDAREWLDWQKKNNRVVPLVKYEGEECVGRGNGLVVDQSECIAVLLEDCGDPAETELPAGFVVKYSTDPDFGEDMYRIVGSPADIRPWHHR